MANTVFQVINAAGATTGLVAFTTGNTTTYVMGSIPLNASGTALIGQQISSNSIGVVIASDQSILPVSIGSATGLASVNSTAGTPAAVAVKNSAATLYGINLFCTNTTLPCYLKLYNITAASVSSASTPYWTIGISPGAPNNPNLPPTGITFTTALSYIITRNVTATDTTAVQINDLVGAINFI